MPVRTICPGCRTAYTLASEVAGKRVRCRQCGQTFLAVEASAASEAVVQAELLGAPAASPLEAGMVPARPPLEAELVLPALPRKPFPPPYQKPGFSEKPRSLASRKSFDSRIALLLAIGGGLSLCVMGGLVLGVLWLLHRGSQIAADGASPLIIQSVSTPVEEPVSVLAPVTTQSLPPAVLEEMKKATVFVKVETARLAGSGSGFVVKTEGETAYVVTNHHVVTPPQDASLPNVFRVPRGPMQRRPVPILTGRDRPAITVVFQSGTQRERALAATVLLADADRDLAVLKVANVSDLPRPIPLIRNPHLIETMPVFLFGFPFGEVLATSRGNPAITVGRGSISSIRLDDHGEVARIQIDGDLNPGNSGGPVVDGQGRLVGIAVAKVRNSQIGLAIPPGTLIKMLEQSVRR
jgi:predicted Zn finger-like uncharacterized protein